MVIVVDSNVIWGKWIIGRIIEVYFGFDGWVCNVKVKILIGEYSWLVIKIVVIYFVEGYNWMFECFRIRIMFYWGGECFVKLINN